MTVKKNVLAISGSVRRESTNLTLLKAIAELTTEVFAVTILENLADIPAFNPDLDNEQSPTVVAGFRQQLRAADGILICTPEYAMGVPGTLKNALDWTISSMEFFHKPVVLLTAALSGEKAHRSLQETLLTMEARLTANTQLRIPFIKSKLGASGAITDPTTEAAVRSLLLAFNKLMTSDFTDSLTESLITSNDIRN